jgi:DTW domain-containing protein YfiP
MIKGQRKIKDPCEGCGLNKAFCLCASIPRLELKTLVTLIIQTRESKKPSNTGLLAIKALTHSEVFVRGLPGQALDFSKILKPNYQPLLLFPSDDAQTLSKKWLSQFNLPIQLLVPDGSWRQASKIHHRHTELDSIPRVKINDLNTRPLHLRKETKPEGMSTLEAIAKALAIIEDQSVGSSLTELYELKLSRTLKARGVI